jgi:serine/threonine protein kinase
MLQTAYPAATFDPPVPPPSSAEAAAAAEQQQQTANVHALVFRKWIANLYHVCNFHAQYINILGAGSLLQQLAGAMQQLHAKGIVHNDVKEANALTDALLVLGHLMWHLGLTDLGVAARVRQYVERKTGTTNYNGMLLDKDQLQQLQEMLRGHTSIYDHVAKYASACTLYDWFGFCQVALLLLSTAQDTFNLSQPLIGGYTAAAAAAAGLDAVSAAAVEVWATCHQQIQLLVEELSSIRSDIQVFALVHAMHVACFELRKGARYQLLPGEVYCSEQEVIDAAVNQKEYTELSLEQLLQLGKSATQPLQPQDMSWLHPMVTTMKEKVMQRVFASLGLLDHIISAIPDPVLLRSFRDLAQNRVPPGEEGGAWWGGGHTYSHCRGSGGPNRAVATQQSACTAI